MTIPAMAPPLNPDEVTEAPTRLLPSVPTGVEKGTVVVAVPVEVTVRVVPLVGRIAAPPDPEAAPVVAMLAHLPELMQNSPDEQQVDPQRVAPVA